jgi:uncharacterized protein (DUF4415 family)
MPRKPSARSTESRDRPVRDPRPHRGARPATGRAKQLIAIRIDPTLLARLRRLAAGQGKPYQTLMHELLEAAVRGAAEQPAP